MWKTTLCERSIIRAKDQLSARKADDLEETAIWPNQTVRLYPPKNQPRHATDAKCKSLKIYEIRDITKPKKQFCFVIATLIYIFCGEPETPSMSGRQCISE
ncbi:hypothetical protein B3286c2_0796 [Brucella vulpis]|nr:hypothetical protein BF3285c2_0801 [Brucella vulpis]CUW51804.1 hypothetical protein B3286c2_0796 [Brucella vulpis]